MTEAHNRLEAAREGLREAKAVLARFQGMLSDAQNELTYLAPKRTVAGRKAAAGDADAQKELREIFLKKVELDAMVQGYELHIREAERALLQQDSLVREIQSEIAVDVVAAIGERRAAAVAQFRAGLAAADAALLEFRRINKELGSTGELYQLSEACRHAVQYRLGLSEGNTFMRVVPWELRLLFERENTVFWEPASVEDHERAFWRGLKGGRAHG
jgi:hypothetical protein